MKKSHYIQDLIAEGEHEHQDFKYQITDARKIARSIAAFANNSGGHLLIGVKDNGNIAGVRSDEEIYMIETAAQMYCRPEQHVAFKVFNINGKSVVKADIAEAVEKPVEAPDDNGNWHVYYRVADENVLASRLHERILRNHLGRLHETGSHQRGKRHPHRDSPAQHGRRFPEVPRRSMSHRGRLIFSVFSVSSVLSVHVSKGKQIQF